MDLSTPQGYLQGLFATGLGFPAFNIPLWFLACLFSVELLHRLAGPRLQSDRRILLAAAGFYVFGYLLTLWVQFFPGPNFWFLHEALVMYAFYLIGVFLRRRGFLLGEHPKGWMVTGAAACGLVLLLTFDLNTGPFRMFDAVVIVLSGHGNFVLFVLTALAGTVLLMLLARLAGANRALVFLGENALILFCLNGVFYHFLNGPFAEWFMAHVPVHWATVTAAGAAFTLASLLLCVPFVLLMNRYLPQLVGKPHLKGPIIGPLVRR